MAKGAYIGALKPEYEPIFKNNSWAQIIKACQKNEVPSTWTIGSQKDMAINGKDYAVDIIGKNHDDYADASGKAPLTFQLHDCYDTSYRMNSTRSNANGWGYSEMRTTHLPAILALMPSEVQAAIKEVNKLTRASYSNSSINTTADKLFLLSMMEIFDATASNSSGEGALGEGSQYAYYKEGNSKIKKMNDTVQKWWARSPRITTSTGYCSVSTAGGASFYNNSHYAQGVSFAFCFGGTSQVDNTFGGNNIARKIKKGYVGIENLARKIKKAYIGIGGVARPCWSGGELAYYGTIAGLKTAVMAHSATSNGTHAIFAGGMPSGATATAYDASLTQTFPSYFDSMYLSSASAAGYSIFGFGATSSGSELTTAQRYDSSLTLTSHSGRQKRKVSGATSIGEFVIFAGGGYGNAATTQNVEFFHAPSMTNGSLATLNYPSYRMGATSVGDYAIFAGGADAQVNASRVAYVVAYDLSTTKTNLTDLSVARNSLGAATVGDYALFAGGNTSSSSSNIVDAYNKSLTRTSAPTLSAAWSEMGATTIGDYAIFAGGMVSGSGITAKAECYDASLTRTSLPSLSMSRYEVKAATIGNYALFGGGSNNNYQSVVDAYTIA